MEHPLNGYLPSTLTIVVLLVTTGLRDLHSKTRP